MATEQSTVSTDSNIDGVYRQATQPVLGLLIPHHWTAEQEAAAVKKHLEEADRSKFHPGAVRPQTEAEIFVAERLFSDFRAIYALDDIGRNLDKSSFSAGTIDDAVQWMVLGMVDPLKMCQSRLPADHPAQKHLSDTQALLLAASYGVRGFVEECEWTTDVKAVGLIIRALLSNAVAAIGRAEIAVGQNNETIGELLDPAEFRTDHEHDKEETDNG
jgi:hypothetical protein